MSLSTAIPRRRALRAGAALLSKYLAAGGAGVLLGLAVTFAVVERGKGFAAVETGPWTSWPRGGTPDLDPYTRAILAFSGKMALSGSAGITFVASGDSNGVEFDSFCDYVIEGDILSARYWTLTLLSPEGIPIPNRANRHGFTSSEILRASGGGFAITVSRNARPGNWLPLGRPSRFILVLNLYDSELGTSLSTLSAAQMPRILKGHCG